MAQHEQKNWSAIAIVVAIIAIIGVFVGVRPTPGQPATTESNQEPIAETTVLSTITLQGRDGMSVLDLLRASHEVETQDSAIGAYVISIDGTGGDSNTFWLYYVDGEAGTIAADQYETSDGETIEWRYEQF